MAFPIPQLRISQTPALIGVKGEMLGKWEMKLPRPTFEIEQPAAKLDMSSPRGDLKIDQSKAWDALGIGGNLENMLRIYSQAPNIALQGIARIVDNGNRMAALQHKGNPIAEIAQEVKVSFPELNYAGEPSYDNVDITYTANKVELNVTEGKVQVHGQPNPAELNYNQGKLEIYLRQKNQIEFTPPQYESIL